MPASSAAMELKVLINILSSGTALNTLLTQTNQLSKALTNLQTQAAGTKPLPSGVPPVPPGIPAKAKESEEAVRKLSDAFNKLHNTMRLAAGGFLAFESVRFVKGLADAAARAEVLQTVMFQVGLNAGISTAKLDQMDKAVQKLGITASASRESITRAIQADIPLESITKLARGAQDAAVILGTDSSTAFDRLVTAIQTQNTLMLRHMGIVLQAQSAYDRFAQTIGKSGGQLTTYQRTVAFTNATLAELAKIEGTYEAAMGNTGKQLTTLTRLTQTLKENLGSALLPAYSAIVVELTNVLKYLGLVSEGMMYQTKAAKDLGESVKNAATMFGDLARALANQRDLVLAAVEGYFIFKVVKFLLADLIGLILRFAVGMEASALAGTGLVAALGGWVTIIVAVIAGIVLLMVQFPRFREGMYAIGTGIWAVVKYIWMLIEAIAKLMVVIGQMIANLKHPFEADWKKPWTEWSDWIKATIKDVTATIDAAQKHWEKALTPPKPEEEAEKEIREANNHLVESLEKRLGLEEQLKVAQKKGIGGQEEAIKLAQDLKDLDKDTVETFKRRGEAYDKAGYDDKKRVEDQIKLEKSFQARQARLAMQGVEEARQGSQFTYTLEGERKGKGFDKALTDYNDLLENYIKKTEGANIGTEELRQNLIEAGKAAKTAHDIKDMADAVDRLRAQRAVERKAGVPERKAGVAGGGITAQDIVDAQNALDTARLEKQKADISETSEIFQRRQTLRQQDQQRQTDYLQSQLEELKSFHALRQSVEDYAFERGRLTVDEYYNRREARIQAAGEREAALAEAALVKAKLMPGRDDVERSARATAIAAAEQAQIQQATEQQGRLDQNNFDRTVKRADLDKQILDLRRSTSAASGSEAAQLEQIDQKYKEMAESLKASADAEGLAVENAQRLAAQQAIVNAHLQERNKLQEEFNKKRYDEGRAREADQRRDLDLAKAGRDTQRANIARRVGEGSLSEVEAMRQRNALTKRDVDDAELALKSLQRDLESTRARQVSAPAELRKRLEAQATADKAQGRVGVSAEEITRQVDTLERDLHETAVSTEVEMAGVTTSIENMMASLESYGKQIKAHFVDAFSDALTQSIMNFQNAGKVWVSLATSIGNDIVSAFMKAFTQKLFSRLGVFNLIDRFVNRIFGGGGKSGGGVPFSGMSSPLPGLAAEGGLVSGPGTGTSDSIPVMVSTGEHIMPAAKVATFLPLLEGIRTGKILPFATGGVVPSLASASIIPRRYATGGVVVADAGAASVQTAAGSGAGGNMIVSLHPDAMNMTMREWLEHEVVRQHGRR